MLFIQRTRKCSVVVEEEDEKENDEEDDDSSSLNRRGSRSEGKLNTLASELRTKQLSIIEVHESSAMSTTVSSKTPPPFVSTQSSPQLLPDDKQNRIGNYITYEQRRSKMHKNRTASCSSSETSDDDTDGRKKRGSSRSLASFKGNDKDPDNDGMGNAGGQGTEPAHEEDTDDQREKDESNGNKTERPNGSAAGRRRCISASARNRRGRSAETRLRESQSLNRITEVQESEVNTPSSTSNCNHFDFNNKNFQVRIII